MLGRRTSTAPPVDDRGTPYPPIPKHAQSSFSSPEGDYLLAYEVSPPPPATPATPGGGNAAAVAAAAAAALAGQTNDYPATLSTAILVFPPSSSSSSGSGLLGLGGSQRSARSRGDPSGQDGIQGFTSMNTASAAGGGGASNNNNNILSSPMSAPGTQDDQTSSSHSGSSYSTPMDNTSSNAAGGSSTNASSAPSPVGRRKPLMSLPSMPSMPMPSLSSNAGNASNSNANGGNASAGPSTSKPKSAFRGTSSSFVKAYEGLPLGGRAEKMWQSNLEAREVTLAIYTTPRATVIVDISPRAKFRDPIAKIGFAATPTCTAVNMNTLSHERLDLLIGFHTGDIVWVEVFSGRYSRYNKDPTTSPPAGGKQTSFVSTSPVKKLQWLQGDQIFASAFQDGCVAFWDKDKEDPNSFVPTMGIAPGSGPIASSRRPPLARVDSTAADSVSNGNSEDGHAVLSGNGSVPINQRGEKHSRRHGSYHLATPDEYTDDIVVTVAQQQVDKKSSSNKFNPIAHWKVSRKSITDFAMSPDDQYCAVTSEDGCLRIIECSSQRLLDTFQGYFGALTCINWSPDGRFVLTGGQDDLACVWSPFEQRIVARCEGHSSFLTGLSFDPWRCDSRTQRFASVSEDCKLILWDLSSAALQRPKGHHQHAHQIAHQRRPSAMSSLSLSRRKTIESSGNLPSTGVVDREGPLWHGAAPRSEVPGLQPVTVKQISSDLLAGITFLPNMVVTISRGGTVKVFLRPDYRP